MELIIVIGIGVTSMLLLISLFVEGMITGKTRALGWYLLFGAFAGIAFAYAIACFVIKIILGGLGVCM